MTQRNDLLDIARGALILLVVWGHLLESKGYDGSLYFSIYAFHIPAFAMISGMISKPRLDAKGLFTIARRLLLPLIVFQVLYIVALVNTVPDRISAVYIPVWIIWFLSSLLTWKLLLPLVSKLPYPLIISVFAALIAGYFDGIKNEYSLSRTLVFFPAFLFGHIYGWSLLEAARRFRIPLFLLFVTIFTLAFWVSDKIDIRWLWGSQPYSAMPAEIPGFVCRAVVIAVGIVMSVAFLAVLPSRSKSLTYLGRRTMPIYLLHGFPVILFWISEFDPGSDFLFVLVTAVLTLAIAFSIAWGRNSIAFLTTNEKWVRK